MGKRGPKPKPTALKIASGVRSDRINLSEPRAIDGEIQPPFSLDKDAKAEWDRIVPVLRQMGVLSTGDAAAIGVYCRAYSRYMEAEDQIRETDLILQDDRGRDFVNPCVAIADKAIETMRKFWNEFGLNPSARSSIKAEPSASDAEDDIDEFLNRRQAT